MYYINKNELLKKEYSEILKQNKEAILKNKTTKDVFMYVLNILSKNTSLELLHNINFSSLIYNYYKNNALYQEFKNKACKNINVECTSKLNNLTLYNDILSILFTI